MLIQFVNTLQHFNDLQFHSDKPVFCDTETDGLYGKVRLLQLFQQHWDKPVVIDVVTFTDSFNLVVERLRDMWLVFHNATYDLYVLGIIPRDLDDTLYLAKQALPHLAVSQEEESRGFSLDKVCYALGLTKLYASLDKGAMQKSDFSYEAVLLPDQYKYAATDVVALSHIYEHLKPHKDTTSYKLDIISMKYAMQYCRNGISVNQQLVEEELAKCAMAIANNIPKLNGLNVNSPKQCKEALGTDSTDKDTLLELIYNGNELAKAIFEQRRLMKRQTMLHSYNHPKVYTVFNVAGAATGRFTATGKNIPCGINAQQITRDMKYLFHNPKKGFVTIEADYSTLELRLAATIFGDENMAQQLRDGKDLHTEVAKAITGKAEITKDDRFKAKTVNFGFVYGMSAKSFRQFAFSNYGLRLSEAEATEWRNTYFKMYPKIGYYHKYVWENYKRPSFVQQTVLGRRIKPKLGTDAINAPVQGSGAECTKLALHFLLKAHPEYINYVVNVVHDSIKLEVPLEKKEEAVEAIEKYMLMAWDELCATKAKMLANGSNSLFHFDDVPMKVDIEIKEGNL